MEFNKYKEIAKYIGAGEVVKEVEKLEEKYLNQELNIVLVGEFASGKTSLINKFFNINLPVDVKPTTATIWKIKGCDEEKYIVHFKNKEVKELSIEEINQIDPKEIAFVEVCVKGFDRNITFVDTPGLSSLDEFHKEALENYIENADVVLLIADINQGLVATSKKFLEDNLTHSQKVYLTLTKADTKPKEEIKKQKEYLENTFEGFERVIAISKDDISELEEVLKEIQSKKEIILKERVEEKLNNLCKMLSSIMDSLLKVDTSDLNSLKIKKEEIAKEIQNIEKELDLKEKEIFNKVDKISTRAADILLDELHKKKDYIAEALFDDDLNEGLNDRLRNVLSDAIKEVAEYIEKELQKDLDALENSLSSYKEYQIEDTVINIIDITVKFREFIIGGLLTLLSRMPYLGPVVVALGEPLKAILDKGTRVLSKKYVISQLEEAFILLKKELKKEIKNNLESNIDMLFEEFTKELQFRKKSFEESLDKLEEEIRNKEKDIEEYINSLKTYKTQLNCKE